MPASTCALPSPPWIQLGWPDGNTHTARNPIQQDTVGHPAILLKGKHGHSEVEHRQQFPAWNLPGHTPRNLPVGI